jgi:hypothetical protein
MYRMIVLLVMVDSNKSGAKIDEKQKKLEKR